MDVFGQQNLKIFGNLRAVLVDTYVSTKIILKFKGWICTICRKFQDGRVAPNRVLKTPFHSFKRQSDV